MRLAQYAQGLQDMAVYFGLVLDRPVNVENHQLVQLDPEPVDQATEKWHAAPGHQKLNVHPALCQPGLKEMFVKFGRQSRGGIRHPQLAGKLALEYAPPHVLHDVFDVHINCRFERSAARTAIILTQGSSLPRELSRI